MIKSIIWSIMREHGEKKKIKQNTEFDNDGDKW